MPSTVHVKIQPRDLPKLIRKLGSAHRDVLRRGVLSGCMRGVAHMQNATTDAGIMDKGGYRMGWAAEPTVAGARIYNKRPYAPIVEEGRRPGARMPPPQVLVGWVQRKLHVPPEDAKGVAFVVARAIARRGIPGHHLLQQAVPALNQIVRTEVDSAVARALALAGGGSPKGHP